MICWSLWSRRNRWLWDNVNVSIFGVQATTLNLLTYWRRAQQEKQKHKPIVNSYTRRWKPPPHGWVTININVPVFLETNSIGIGCVIRDENGGFVRARGQKIAANFHPREAEAMSLKEALSWTKALGFRRCIFKSDADILVDACKGERGGSYFHSIVLDCIELFKHFDDVLIEFVHRFANGVAHVLARAARPMSDIQEWGVTIPDFIFDSLIDDSII